MQVSGLVGEIRTVNGNGNAFCEDETIGTLESGNLAQLVEQLIVGRECLFARVGVDSLDIELVGLCDGLAGGAARVGLDCISECIFDQVCDITNRMHVQLSERHDG